MVCPGCRGTMQRLHLEGKLDRVIDVDACASCRVIWFDRYEELQLAASATLTLFEIIAKPAPTERPVDLSHPLPCPVCRARLVVTHDMQRATKFVYWRCPSEHGHLISFVDFLRAKDFVRPLTPIELNRLKQTVGTVHCDNCGAPIDLVRDSLCAHCGSPISILDPTQTARTIARLQHEATGTPDPGGAAEEAPGSAGMDAVLRAIKSEGDPVVARGMVNVGLRFLSDLLKKG